MKKLALALSILLNTTLFAARLTPITVATRAFHHTVRINNAQSPTKCPFLKEYLPFVKKQEEIRKTQCDEANLQYTFFRATLTRMHFENGYPLIPFAAQNLKNQKHQAQVAFEKALKNKSEEILRKLAKKTQSTNMPESEPQK